MSRSIICSLPDNFTIGVFQNQINAMVTNTTDINPMKTNIVNAVAKPSYGFRYDSYISIHPSVRLLPQLYLGHNVMLQYCSL